MLSPSINNSFMLGVEALLLPDLCDIRSGISLQEWKLSVGVPTRFSIIDTILSENIYRSACFQ